MKIVKQNFENIWHVVNISSFLMDSLASDKWVNFFIAFAIGRYFVNILTSPYPMFIVNVPRIFFVHDVKNLFSYCSDFFIVSKNEMT